MEIQKQLVNNACTLKINGELKIYEVATCKDEIFKDFSQYKSLELDLSELEDIDVSGMQLLMLLKKEAEKKQLTFKIISASTPTKKLLELFQLTDWFQI